MARQGAKTDAETKAKFLEKLTSTCNVTLAAREIGVHRGTAYRWREGDEEFAQAWDNAIDEAVDALESEAHRRAFQGTTRPIVQGGKVVKDDNGNPLILHEYSDTLAIFLLKAHRPEKYRERHDLTGTVTNKVLSADPLTEDEWAEQYGDKTVSET